jgi:flagellar hook assembly protein FlgD
VFDVSGRVVRVLLDRWAPAGEDETVWDGRDDRGQPVPAGVYLYELDAPGFRAARRMVKLR